MTGGTMTIRRVVAIMLAVVTAGWLAGCASAGAPQADAAPQGSHGYSQAELDQMLAPIALYPDPLLSQLLMASTYPLEVVEAARWSRDYEGYRGDEAVSAVQDQDWDPSVKSLVAFPQVLETMDQHLQWTEDLGNAFLSQQTQVMDTIQKLRHKAYLAGTLRSNREITVVLSGPYIYIQYASPDVVYVPYYDPTIVFGDWWWADYPPVYWAPWSGYYVVSGFGWGSATYVSTGFFFGGCDWRYNRVDVVNVRAYYYAPRRMSAATVSRYLNTAPGAWRHNPQHRRGVPYRNAKLRHEIGRPYTPGAPARDGSLYRGPGYQMPATGLGAPGERAWQGSGPGTGSAGQNGRVGTGYPFSSQGGAAQRGAPREMPAAVQGGWQGQGGAPAQNQQRFQAPQGGWRPQNVSPAQNQQRFPAPQGGWRPQNVSPAQDQQRFQAPQGNWRRQDAPSAPQAQQAPMPGSGGQSSSGRGGWRQEGGYASPQGQGGGGGGAGWNGGAGGAGWGGAGGAGAGAVGGGGGGGGGGGRRFH